MAKEPNILIRTPSAPVKSNATPVNISNINIGSLKVVLPPQIPGAETSKTSDGKFNMQQLQKFEYFAKSNITPSPETAKTQDWKDYGEFLNMDKESKNKIASEYSAWKKENEPVNEVANDTQQTQEESNEAPATGGNLSIDDQIKALKIKDKMGLLSIDDRNNLDNLEKAKAKEDVPEVKRRNKQHEDPVEEDKGPFEQGDIIDYMYNKWLIAGANWTWVKTDKHIRKTGYAMANAFQDQLRKNREAKAANKNAKTTKTKEFDADTNLKLAEDLQNKYNRTDENMEKIVKRHKLIAEGKFDEAGVSDDFKKKLEEGEKKYGKNYVKDYCNNVIEHTKDMSETFKHIQTISSTIVHAEVDMLKINNVKEGEKDASHLSKRQDDVSIHIISQINKISKEGGDVPAFIKTLSEKAKGAKEFAQGEIEKDNVNEFGKNNIQNQNLNEVMDMIVNGEKPKENEQTLIQALNNNYSNKEHMDKAFEENFSKNAEVTWRKENNMDRKENIEKLKENLKSKDKLNSGRVDILETTRDSEYGGQKKFENNFKNTGTQR
ncbi:MAG: hypothetical protein ACK5N8_06185 [Alphaproteobacteria bacterium]